MKTLAIRIGGSSWLIASVTSETPKKITANVINGGYAIEIFKDVEFGHGSYNEIINRLEKTIP